MSVQELKTDITGRLKKLGEVLDQFDRMQIAINLKIALATINRYMSGIESEVRRLELAETIIKETEAVIANKQKASNA